jgi:MerR family copper efflux transcriptional regulator
MKGLTIGQVARRAGLGVETVRYYEREGLLAAPARRPSGYRAYPEEVVARLRFIRRAKELGFTLREIKDHLELSADPATTRAELRGRAEEKVTDVEARIADLTRVRDALRALAAACDGHGPLDGCPILHALGHDPAAD